MPTIDEANRITYCNIQWYMIFDHCNCLGYSLDTDCRTKLKAQKRRFMLRKYGNRPFWAKKQIFGNLVFSKSTICPIPNWEDSTPHLISGHRSVLLLKRSKIAWKIFLRSGSLLTLHWTRHSAVELVEEKPRRVPRHSPATSHCCPKAEAARHPSMARDRRRKEGILNDS